MSETEQHILAARARALARRPKAGAENGEAQSAETQSGETQSGRGRILCLAVGGEVYGVPAGAVIHATALTRFTTVPSRVPSLIGLVGFGGRPCNVLDLGRLLGLGAGKSGIGGSGDTATGYIAILRDFAPRMALRCDRIVGVFDAVPLPAAGGDAGRRAAITGYARLTGATGADAALSITLLDIHELLKAFAKATPSTGETVS